MLPANYVRRMAGNTRVSAATAFAGLLMLTGCATVAAAPPSEPADESPPTTSALARDQDDPWALDAPGPPTLGGQLAEFRDDDGVLSLQGALDLFASTFGEMPGGDPERFDLPEHLPTSMAVRWMLSYLDQLDDDQRATLDRWIAPGEVYTDAGPHIHGFRRTAGADEEDRAGAALHDLAMEMRALIAERLGSDLGIVLATSLAPADVPFTRVRADGTVAHLTGTAVPEREGVAISSGRPDGCLIVVWGGAADFAATVAHEVFHCFQYAIAADVSHVLRGQDWIYEGQAAWVEVDLTGPNDVVLGLYRSWFCDASPLTDRTYDAVGFYATLDEMGIDPWSIFPDMIGRSGRDAIRATGVDVETMMRRIASTRFREPRSVGRFGVDWRLDPVGAGEIQCLVGVTLEPESRRELRAELGQLESPMAVEVHAEGEVLTWRIEAPIGIDELRASGPRSFTTEIEGRLCLQEACVCPDGRVDLAMLERGDEALPLAIATATDEPGTVVVTLETITVEAACSLSANGVITVRGSQLTQTFYSGRCTISAGRMSLEIGAAGSSPADGEGGGGSVPHPGAAAVLSIMFSGPISDDGTVPGWSSFSFGVHFAPGSADGIGIPQPDGTAEPTVFIGPGLRTGSIESRNRDNWMHVSWSCPAILVPPAPPDGT